MTNNQRFALGLLGCAMIWTDVVTNLPTPIGVILACVGGSIAGWNGMALWMKGKGR